MEILCWVVLAALTVVAVWGWFSSSYWRNDSYGHRESFDRAIDERDRAYDRAEVAERRLNEFRKLIGSLKDS